MLLPASSTIAVPMLWWAAASSPAPSRMLTNAQHPSPIMVAAASAITVSGNTTELAALPTEPK